MFEITLFESVFKNVHEGLTDKVDWEDVKTILAHRYDRLQKVKEALPVIFPGTYKTGDKSKASAEKSNVNVNEISLAILDYDNFSPEDFPKFFEGLLGYNFVIYSTWSHAASVDVDVDVDVDEGGGRGGGKGKGKGKYKFRLVMTLSKPVKASNWQIVWNNLAARFKEGASAPDASAKNASRSYYLPYLSYDPNKFPEKAKKELWYSGDGRDIDVDSIMEDFEASNGEAGDVDSTKYIESTWFTGEHVRQFVTSLKKNLNISAVARLLRDGDDLQLVKGERNNALLPICTKVGECFPTVKPDKIYEVMFAPSLKFDAIRYPEDPLSEAEVVKMIRQAQVKQRTADELAKRSIQALQEAQAKLAEACNVDVLCKQLKWTPEQLKRRLIVQHSGVYYILISGEYERVVGRPAAISKLHQSLEPFKDSLGVNLYEYNEKGKPTPRQIEMLVAEYGQVVSNITYDMRARSYDLPDSSTFEYPLYRWFDNEEPVYSDFADGWIKSMAGSSEVYEKLNNWLAWSIDLDQPLSLLYLIGRPGLGKTLLANCLANFWAPRDKKYPGAPSDFLDALGTFNDAIMSNPLLFGDEGFPPGKTRDMRRIISRENHSVNRKYQDHVSVSGYVRILCTSNHLNDYAVFQGEVFEKADIEALNQRCFYVHMEDRAADYLKKGGRKRIGEMKNSGEFRSHVLWLKQRQEELEVERDRFGTTPDNTFMKRIVVSSGIPALLMRWVCGYLADTRVNQQRIRSMIIKRKGKVALRSDCFDRDWSKYVHDLRPGSVDIGNAYRLITKPGERHAIDGAPRYYDYLDQDFLEVYLEALNPYQRQEVLDAIKVDSELDS
jgi:hypothetical protein